MGPCPFYFKPNRPQNFWLEGVAILPEISTLKEAEFRCMASTLSEIIWLRGIATEFRMQLTETNYIILL